MLHCYFSHILLTKLWLTFTQTHFESWLKCLSCPTLGENIFATGTEILFNLEILRHHQTTSSSGLALPSHFPPGNIPFLPRIFVSYLHAIKKHRNALFGQGSDSLKAASDLKFAGIGFFTSCLASLDGSEVAWEVRRKLLDIVDQENLVGMDENGVVESNVELAVNTLGGI
jgi:hypothetical protein